MALTITEALAEIKTIAKRIDSKKQFVIQYLSRHEGLKDPLEKDGGASDALKRERQAITDLEKRVVTLRRAIQRANDATQVTLEGMTMAISDWLAWRRDVLPGRKMFLDQLRQRLVAVRETAKRSGVSVMGAAVALNTGDAKPTDIIINIDEQALAQEIEQLVNIEGQLDGQLSLKNATTQIVEE